MERYGNERDPRKGETLRREGGYLLYVRATFVALAGDARSKNGRRAAGRRQQIIIVGLNFIAG